MKRVTLCKVAACAGGAILFLFLALDGRLHWDEPAYLYTGAYLDVGEILQGEFQPSGNANLYTSRILHILLIRAIVSVTGPGATALGVVTALYICALLAFSWITWMILRELLSDGSWIGAGFVVAAFTPLYLYFAFKTLPELPALAFSALATFGLLRSMKERALLWIVLTAVALVAMALLRNNFALSFLSLIPALILCKRRDYPAGKLIVHAAVSGLGSLVLFAVTLKGLGIGLDQYLAVVAPKLSQPPWPLIAKALNTGIEGGLLFLALPLAFLGPRRDAVFFATWFLIATIPVLVLLEDINTRFLASNLVPLTGMLSLAIGGLSPIVSRWWSRSRLLTATAGVTGMIAVVSSNLAALAVMSHEVRMDQFHAVLTALDRTYGADRYAILTPWAYTDFHYLRFAYPNREVYNVYTILTETSERSAVVRAVSDRYYGDGLIKTVEQLEGIDRSLIYLGFEENHSVANLRDIVRFAPALGLEKQLEKVSFLNHLAYSWMWKHPRIELTEQLRLGHYVAYTVKLLPVD